MSTNSLLLDINERGIATLTLNRPETHNAFDATLIKDLTEHLQQLDINPAVRVVILAANGKSFCAGADVNWMRSTINYSRDENFHDAMKLAQLLNTLYQLSKPTIALVQGAAYGGGVGLVACCDIAIATAQASFCLSEVKLGLIGATIGPYVLAAMGERATRRYFLTAERFDAANAQRLGLIHEIVAENNLTAIGLDFTEKLLQNSPHALATAKNFISTIVHQPIDTVLMQASAEALAAIRVSTEGQEGLNAFLEKRKPAWIK